MSKPNKPEDLYENLITDDDLAGSTPDALTMSSMLEAIEKIMQSGKTPNHLILSPSVYDEMVLQSQHPYGCEVKDRALTSLLGIPVRKDLSIPPGTIKIDR
jgi:hypothetical protein